MEAGDLENRADGLITLRWISGGKNLGGTMWMESLQNGIVRLHSVYSLLCCNISQPGRAHKFRLETNVDRFLASN